jgi:hypothetical protein
VYFPTPPSLLAQSLPNLVWILYLMWELAWANFYCNNLKTKKLFYKVKLATFNAFAARRPAVIFTCAPPAPIEVLRTPPAVFTCAPVSPSYQIRLYKNICIIIIFWISFHEIYLFFEFLSMNFFLNFFYLKTWLAEICEADPRVQEIHTSMNQ